LLAQREVPSVVGNQTGDGACYYIIIVYVLRAAVL